MGSHIKKLIIIALILMLIVPIGCTRKVEEPPKNNVQQPPDQEEPRAEIPSAADMILSAENWKEEYPLIYESFLRTSRMQDNKVEDSELGGLHPIDYLKKYPDIKVLYEGIGFAKEYYVARGHYYALEDVINSTRPKPGASCLACKTADYEKLYVENKENLFKMDFNETAQTVENSITCYNCHRNEPGKQIQITSPQFAEAVKKLDEEPKPGTTACAQCHVEYYFDKESGKIILPWDNGREINEIESYYDEMNFADWTHPTTGTPLIKVQHPETELYSGSVHDRMGITCADCHMPNVVEEGQEYKSHWAKSPLKTVDESCGKCHDQEAEKTINWVQGKQQEISDLEGEVSGLLVQLIEDMGQLLKDNKLDDKTTEEIRSLHRKAQYRWDFIFVENSTGFHNFDKSRKALEEARGYAQEALDIMKEFK